ncbi:Peptidase [Abditibacterium utsteinense]|uniref:Peptidase n=2 Tax=Abditibacterium utsteinense TaxID=1960156 RepID=A0A2S8SRS8_9BACT|nr:Peptidase [Abditibacterium utsteinense]
MGAGLSCQAQTQTQTPATLATAGETEAVIYSTLPSMTVHRPEMAMDANEVSYFKSVYGMGDGDDFTVMFSRPVPLRSLRISTGNADGDNLLTKGFVEISTDGTRWSKAATFNAQGVASATLQNQTIAALRIKLNPNSALPSLVLREITLDSPVKVTHVSWGAGRAFSDYSVAPDLKEWARKADQQMDESWADTAALLYTDNFITPNKVNVVYKSGPDVTGVAATGGGEMTVNVAWARAHPDDTGLTVHEVAHVVQAMSAYDPVWLIEGTADYVRWVKFEPQNFKVNINPKTATYHDSYRTTAAFLAWCELNYDSRLVSKLNRDTRLGAYKIENFKKYTGKDVDTLWSEFLAAYKTDPVNVITPPVAAADRPRALPVVKAGTSVAVDLSKSFNAVGITRNGRTFGADNGFDSGGAAFSGALVGKTVTAQGVQFSLGAPDMNNIVAARNSVIALPRQKFSSLWLLGAATEGGQRGQTFVVTYSDGSVQTLSQNLSDWFSPQGFPGESRGLKTEYRNLGTGIKDPRPFSLYTYGFAVDNTKAVQSLTLPDNPNIKIAAASLAH